MMLIHVNNSDNVWQVMLMPKIKTDGPAPLFPMGTVGCVHSRDQFQILVKCI